MKTQNNAQLIGYLGNDPIIRQTRKGQSFALLNLATHVRVKKDGKQAAYYTVWHNIIVWGNQHIRDLSNQYMKGSHLLVEGSLQYATYTDKNGQARSLTQIKAHHLINLDR